MKETVYLFKERFSCTEVFFPLYEHIKETHNCVRIIDEIQKDSVNDIIKDLVGKNIVLITSDHFSSKYNNNYSIDEIVKFLNPIKKIYSFHDLGIHKISETDLKDWEIFIPSPKWDFFLKGTEFKRHYVSGYPKYSRFLSPSIEYKTIFFPSLIYVYKERPYSSFYDNFKYIIEENIPIKFPEYEGSYVLIEKMRKAGIEMNLIDPSLSSFDFLFRCVNSITNSNSSIAIEASIAGANSVNIGVGNNPVEFYNEFGIKNINNSSLLGNYLLPDRNNLPLLEYKFNYDLASKAISYYEK